MNPVPRPQPNAKAVLGAACLALLCIATYLPAVNNGFISDDYIMLDWVEKWKSDFSFLFKLAPDVFRMTNYAVLLAFTSVFGYNSAILYAFVIFVHFVNCLLLFLVCRSLGGSVRHAAIASVILAVVQKPQEAIMWLAAMPYVLGGFCALASLLLWLKGRRVAATLVFLLGIFSTESLLVLVALIPLLDARAERKLRWRKQYLLLLVPPLVFAAVFALTLPVHHMVNERTYILGWHAASVFAKSLFRLVTPTLLVVFVVFSLLERRRFFAEISWGMAWMSIALLPFIFLTYQGFVPSRHNYLPVIGLAFALGGLLAAARHFRLANLAIAAFALANISYIWIRKDAQFEMRAQPTTQLLIELRKLTPQPIRVTDFPMNPWIAKMAARHVPGWQPEWILAGVPGEPAIDCPGLRWNPGAGRYDPIAIRAVEACVKPGIVAVASAGNRGTGPSGRAFGAIPSPATARQ